MTILIAFALGMGIGEKIVCIRRGEASWLDWLLLAAFIAAAVLNAIVAGRLS